MDFKDAVIFVAAILVVVGSGILLGLALRRRQPVSPGLQEARVNAYTNLIKLMDGLRRADDRRKREFIETYYQATMVAPDSVLKSLNYYLQLATATDGDFDPSAQATARDRAVLAMRQDVQRLQGQSTGVGLVDLYSIEIGKAASSAEVPAPAPSYQPEPADDHSLSS